MAFTDQVSHAAMAGQYQLEQTFPACRSDAMLDEPERSPLRISSVIVCELRQVTDDQMTR